MTGTSSPHTQVRGLPFRAAELAAVLQDTIDGTTTSGNGAAHFEPHDATTTQTGAAL